MTGLSSSGWQLDDGSVVHCRQSPFGKRSAALRHICNASADRNSDFKAIPTEMHRAIRNMASGNLFQINRHTQSHTRLLLSRAAQDALKPNTVKSRLTTGLNPSESTELNIVGAPIPTKGAGDGQHAPALTLSPAEE